MDFAFLASCTKTTQRRKNQKGRIQEICLSNKFFHSDRPRICERDHSGIGVIHDSNGPRKTVGLSCRGLVGTFAVPLHNVYWQRLCLFFPDWARTPKTQPHRTPTWKVCFLSFFIFRAELYFARLSPPFPWKNTKIHNDAVSGKMIPIATGTLSISSRKFLEQKMKTSPQTPKQAKNTRCVLLERHLVKNLPRLLLDVPMRSIPRCGKHSRVNLSWTTFSTKLNCQ